ALAAGLGCLAQGSDGGGSIRIPSACCGIVGLKPSRGRVTMAPASGEVWAGFATSGPMARSVRDDALFLDVLAGHVIGEPCWPLGPVGAVRTAVDIPPRHLRIAVLPRSAVTRGDPESEAALASAAKVFAELGHEVEAVKCDPAARLKDPVMALIGANIASVAVEKPALMDPVVRFAGEPGRKMSAHEYIPTATQMHNIARAIVQELAPYDAILSPTLGHPAPRLGTLPSSPERYQDELPEWVAYTFAFNATGQPAFSLPNGFNKAALPIGLQIVGKQADEVTIVGLDLQFEEARPLKNRHPPID